VPPKGLICAGGEATRLGELTRVTNKHLLPVAGWPMVYYPLQLLQLAGIRDVLLVTGKGHAGQMIDLLGDGRLAPRGGGDPILEVDLTYKVQTEPGGIAQVVGMAEDFAGGAPLVVVLGDNIFEYAQSGALAEWAEASGQARIFVKEVEDPENFGVVVYAEDGRVVDIVEKAGVVDTRYAVPCVSSCPPVFIGPRLPAARRAAAGRNTKTGSPRGGRAPSRSRSRRPRRARRPESRAGTTASP